MHGTPVRQRLSSPPKILYISDIPLTKMQVTEYGNNVKWKNAQMLHSKQRNIIITMYTNATKSISEVDLIYNVFI